MKTFLRERPWLWFFAAFALLLAAWIALFWIASRHRVQEVPLETRRAPPRVEAPAGPGETPSGRGAAPAARPV